MINLGTEDENRCTKKKCLPIPSTNIKKECAHSLLRERMFMLGNVTPRQYRYLVTQLGWVLGSQAHNGKGFSYSSRNT